MEKSQKKETLLHIEPLLRLALWPAKVEKDAESQRVSVLGHLDNDVRRSSTIET